MILQQSNHLVVSQAVIKLVISCLVAYLKFFHTTYCVRDPTLLHFDKNNKLIINELKGYNYYTSRIMEMYAYISAIMGKMDNRNNYHSTTNVHYVLLV